jgi:hypothetical protein
MRVGDIIGHFSQEVIDLLDARGWNCDDDCYWHDAIDNFHWSSTPEGHSFWCDIANAYDVDEVLNMFSTLFSDNETRLERAEKESRRYAEKVSGHQFTKDVYAYCIDSGICSSPSDSEWLNRWLCSTLNLG